MCNLFLAHLNFSAQRLPSNGLLWALLWYKWVRVKRDLWSAQPGISTIYMTPYDVPRDTIKVCIAYFWPILIFQAKGFLPLGLLWALFW